MFQVCVGPSTTLEADTVVCSIEKKEFDEFDEKVRQTCNEPLAWYFSQNGKDLCGIDFVVLQANIRNSINIA